MKRVFLVTVVAKGCWSHADMSEECCGKVADVVKSTFVGDFG